MGLLIFLLEIVLVGIVAIFGYLFYKNYQFKKYFQQWGVPYIQPNLGALFRILTGKVSLYDTELIMYKLAKDTNSPFVGLSDAFVNPAVYVTDLELTKHIYVKSFDHFVNRRSFTSAKGDLLFKRMLIMMEDEQWKGMRAKLSPSFTTGKIRRMFEIFSKSSKSMCDYLTKEVGTSEGDYDITDVYSKYSMDVIASCVFGIDSKTFENEPGKLSQFEEMGQLLQFKFDGSRFLKFLLVMAAPKVADYLGIESMDLRPQLYFREVIQKVLKHRRETGERQDDFLQIMMDIQQGLLKDEENSKEVLEVMTGSAEGKSWEDSNKFTKFDDDDIAANSVLFLLAGFDTLQSVLTFTTYALALNQEVQQKLMEEIRESMESNGGKLTYDGVHEMKYLDMVINETLRFYPPTGRTERLCTKRFEVPGTNAVIEKGVIVTLPVLGVHRDPEYYENPEMFDPERFLPEEKSKRHPYSFAPFGHGNRNCIGMRFALTEVKAVICSLVSNFHLEPCTRTVIPPKFANNTTAKPANGMWLQFCPRSK